MKVSNLVKRSDRYEWTLLLPRTGPGIKFDQYLSHEHQRRGIQRSRVERIDIDPASPPKAEIVALPSGRRLTIIGPLKPREITESLNEFMGEGRGR